MSGHSKFSNIKRKKEKNDKAKGRIFTQIGREIAVSVKMGGPDPASNSRLKDAIAKAKANNMPNDTIERSIKKAAGDLNGIQYESVTYEGYGPSGVALIVEALTDNKNRTAANVRNAFTKGGGNMGTTGCVGFLFDEKGLIIVEKDDAIDEEEFMLMAIDAGAEDFTAEEDGFVITTATEDFSAVRQALEDAKVAMISAEVTNIPQTTVKLGEEDIKKLNKTIDLLNEDDDVKNFWHNWEEE